MSQLVGAGPPATPDDLRAAQERDRLLSTELPRVRAAAVAWRNGLAGLLTALAGFSLIKGHSDISKLAETWAIGAGIALLVAFLAGAAGALLLIRAANGRPAIARVRRLLTRAAADHEEALAASTALRTGTAVGLTWYGPSRTDGLLRVTTPAGTQCGSLLQFSQGKLIIDTAAGAIVLDQTQPSTIQPVAACPSP
jgi:hypothetical protein